MLLLCHKCPLLSTIGSEATLFVSVRIPCRRHLIYRQAGCIPTHRLVSTVFVHHIATTLVWVIRTVLIRLLLACLLNNKVAHVHWTYGHDLLLVVIWRQLLQAQTLVFFIIPISLRYP
jgi:hypothetical protein